MPGSPQNTSPAGDRRDCRGAGASLADHTPALLWCVWFVRRDNIRTKRMSGLSCHRLPKSIVAESRRKPGPIRVHYPIYLRGTSTILIRGDRSAHLSASEWSTKLLKDGSTERFTNYIHSRLVYVVRCVQIYIYPARPHLLLKRRWWFLFTIYYLLVDHTYTYLQTPLCDCAGENQAGNEGTKAGGIRIFAEIFTSSRRRRLVSWSRSVRFVRPRFLPRASFCCRLSSCRASRGRKSNRQKRQSTVRAGRKKREAHARRNVYALLGHPWLANRGSCVGSPCLQSCTKGRCFGGSTSTEG